MPRRLANLLLLSVLCLAPIAACSSRGGVGEEERPRVVRPPSPPPRPSAPPPVYDDQGKLLESSIVVAGLPVPRGFVEDPRPEDRTRLFHGRVPPMKVTEYLGARLLTGQIDRVGSNAVYRAAVPRAASGGVVKLDVSVRVGPGGTALEIHEIPPLPAKLPTQAEVQQMLRELPQE